MCAYGQGKPRAPSFGRMGGAGGPGYDRVLGLTLELVPEKDPTALTPLPQGTELPVRRAVW